MGFHISNHSTIDFTNRHRRLVPTGWDIPFSEQIGVEIPPFLYDCTDENGTQRTGVVCNPVVELPEGCDRRIVDNSEKMPFPTWRLQRPRKPAFSTCRGHVGSRVRLTTLACPVPRDMRLRTRAVGVNWTPGRRCRAVDDLRHHETTIAFAVAKTWASSPQLRPVKSMSTPPQRVQVKAPSASTQTRMRVAWQSAQGSGRSRRER